jgi:hypothetical protein
LITAPPCIGDADRHRIWSGVAEVCPATCPDDLVTPRQRRAPDVSILRDPDDGVTEVNDTWVNRSTGDASATQ